MGVVFFAGGVSASAAPRAAWPQAERASLAEPLPKEARETKEWSMLLFLNGNNNLDGWATEDLLEMERVGSQAGFHVVVQWSSLERKKTERRYIQKRPEGAPADQVHSPVIEDMGLVDMGDWRTLAEFLEWGIENFPARKHFVAVWDHGTGWHELRASDISQDDFTGNWITTQQLGWALKRAAQKLGHPVDFYASDACLMGMLEVATELSPSVRIYGGSVADIPVTGWPYEAFLAEWSERPEITAEELGKLLSQTYFEHYRAEPKKKGATFSIFDLGQLGPVLDGVRGLKDALLSLPASELPKLRDAMLPVYDYTIDYGDLGMMIDALQGARLAGGAPEKLRTALGSFVLTNVATPSFSKSQGVSLWIPGAMKWYKKYLAQYRGLRFSRETEWERVASLFANY